MNASVNKVMLRRRHGFVPSASDVSVPTDVVVAVRALADLGYAPSPELLSVMSASAVVAADVVNVVGGVVTPKSSMTPFHRGFPRAVMDAGEIDLYVRALIHYLTLHRVGLGSDAFRQVREEYPDLKVVDLAHEDDVVDLVKSLLSTSSPLNEADAADVIVLVRGMDPSHLPELGSDIPVVANAAMVSALIERDREGFSPEVVEWERSTMKSPEHIFRATLALGGTDPVVSPRSRVRLNSVPTSWRRFATRRLSLFSERKVRASFARHEGLWKLVLSALDVNRFGGSTLKTLTSALRDGELTPPYHDYETALSEGGDALTECVKEMTPNEVARRARAIISHGGDVDVVADALAHADARVLFTADASVNSPVRAYVERDGGAVHIYGERDEEDEEGRVFKEVVRSALATVLGGRDHAGVGNTPSTVFIDPSVEGVRIPTSTKSMSKSDTLVGRGSAVRIPDVIGADGKAHRPRVIRAFTHWRNIDDDSVDIDLSQEVLNETGVTVASVNYYNLREKGITHSGDIVDAPEGAAEFIDINVDELLKAHGDARWVVTTIHSYSGQDFNTIPELFSGVAVLDDAEAGEVWDARSAVIRMDVSAPARSSVSVAIDIVEGVVVLVDSVNARIPDGFMGTLTTASSTFKTLEAVSALSLPGVGDVVRENASARGIRIVDNREDADVVFEFGRNGMVPPMDVVMSEWL